MPKYDERLLLDFANRFLGYGSLKSHIWLIGPEQGGGGTIDDLYWRASLWSERGEKETEDLHSYHAALKAIAIANTETNDGASRAAAIKLSEFDWTRKIQPTWGPLIRVVLALDGKRAETEDVRDFQKRELGRTGGQNCVLDLCPLSSPSKKSDWKLNEPGFTRKEMEAHLIPRRCDLLRMRLDRHKPRLVLFYGLEEQSWWGQISAHELIPSELHLLSLARGKNTLFAMIPHPVNLNTRLPSKGEGAVKRFLADVGAVLREELR